jgi:hypothetical protein
VFRTTNASSGVYGASIPQGTTPLSNALYANTMPKAWGYIPITAGVVGTLSGVNYSAVHDGTNNRINLTLDRAMANSQWMFPSWIQTELTGGAFRDCIGEVVGTNTARIWLVQKDGNTVDIDTFTGVFGFMAIGRQI